ncbi:presenilins-associated rhomboid-like protein, mitochondrial [Pectinophora gossypiella]|uniref:presenilins-associated rhomboid-like protein, mitochondrial n=1 Tax=Pectinophora gossypiella TaxID=13191 RepID=UPI00214EF90C|nr:presenilins-associated rhomboid-like protein, mitochondrial [Pectinophora gossypiella]
MFFRNVWSAAELTASCKTSLLRQRIDHVGYGRTHFRNSFHNSRRGPRRQGFEPDPLEHLQIESGPLHIRGLVRPFLFTIGVSTASLAGCVIWEYENLRAHATNLFRRPSSWLSAQQKKILAQYKSETGPLKKWWNSLKESEKVFYPILAANVIVFGAWRVRSLQPFMVKYFCSNPAGSKVCMPMILSAFSHYSALHLAANMYVLYSFMPAALAALGKEQFVAMYLSGGVISSFASFLYKVMVNQPGLSLGASGAIMSVLAYVCVQYPDTKLSIIFLPMYTFAAGSAIKVIMSVDLAGVVFGWKFFDHAAHLGGAMFGMAWCYWGGAHIWGNRDKFLQYYHTLRKSDADR